MDAALSIASSAIDAATTEIAVTSENIANASTPGYIEESAQLSAQPGGDTLGVGDGVAVTSVSQVASALLTSNNNQAQASLSSLSSLQQVLTGIQNVFPLGQSSAAAAASSTQSSNSSIAGQLANFWSAWDGIAQDPSSTAPRTEVIDLAQGLATSLNEASGQLSQLASNTSNEVESQVSQVNTLLGQAASLNQSIALTLGDGGNANQLLDELGSVSSQLASSIGATVQTQKNGTAQISLNGITLVQGDLASSLSVSGSGSSTSITAENGSESIPVSVSSGSVSGLLSGLTTSIPDAESSLDAVASNLATTVNYQLSKGYTATGVAGTGFPLFTSTDGSTSATITAGTIAVNPTIAGTSTSPADPVDIAAASSAAYASGAEANDGSNAAAMAELASNTATTGATPSPDAAYQQLVQNIGSQTQNVSTQVTAQTSVADQAQQSLQSATGVNTNTELTNLMQFQNAYQASAKLVSVIDATIQSLMAAI